MTAQEILQAAIDAISDRAPFRDTDGEKSFALAADLFGSLSDRDFTDMDACLFLACVKLSRAMRGEFHVDDWVDAASYIGLAGEAYAGQVRPVRKGPEACKDMRDAGSDGWNSVISDAFGKP